MKILVNGGTGFIGSHILNELLSRYPQASIRILSRRVQTANPWGNRVEFVQGNVVTPGTLSAAVENVDIVVHCVQFPNHPVENPSKGWTYLEVDAKGTRNMVRICENQGIRRFIYVSGAGVSPEKKQPWFVAKRLAEESVRGSRMPYVILRPSWVYGPRDRSLNRFIAFGKYLPFIPVIGSGKNKVQPISVFDVAKVSALSISLSGATNKVFELGGPQELTMDQILHIVQKVLGKHRPLMHHPASLMKIIAGLLSILPNPPLSPRAIDFILMEEKVDPKPAEQVFGTKFEDLETGLRRYLNCKIR